MSAVEYLAYLRPFYPTWDRQMAARRRFRRQSFGRMFFQPRQWAVRHVTIDGLRLNAWTSDIGGSP